MESESCKFVYQFEKKEKSTLLIRDNGVLDYKTIV